jgi:hypothetical protein
MTLETRAFLKVERTESLRQANFLFGPVDRPAKSLGAGPCPLQQDLIG